MINGVEIPIGFGIQLRVDYLNALVLIAIGVVVLLVSIFAIRKQGEQDTEKTHYFYALFLMLSCGLFGMTITTDAFNLFVLGRSIIPDQLWPDRNGQFTPRNRGCIQLCHHGNGWPLRFTCLVLDTSI